MWSIKPVLEKFRGKRRIWEAMVVRRMGDPLARDIENDDREDLS
jgi:hypothetical protein